jgi:hypothetical protein
MGRVDGLVQAFHGFVDLFPLQSQLALESDDGFVEGLELRFVDISTVGPSTLSFGSRTMGFGESGTEEWIGFVVGVGDFFFGSPEQGSCR